MKSMINENVLIQMETELDDNGRTMFRIITFSRHSHRVHKTKWFMSYNNANKLFEDMIKVEYEF